MNATPTQTSPLDKPYDPTRLEPAWYAQWERLGYFDAGTHVAPADGDNNKPFVIQFPPPNVTGTVHMGHAFNQTIIDSLVRYHRMRGDDSG